MNDDLGKARDRLHGLISTYPNEIELRRKLGDIYFSLKYPTMAGRYWYLEEKMTPEMEKACTMFEQSEGNNSSRIARAIKYKGNPDIIKKLHLEQGSSPIKDKVKEKLVEVPTNTLGDKLVTIGCIFILILIFCFTSIGIITIFRWIF
ncbi:DNA helicase [Bacillus sp. ISL-7]|nr:DNA helicase [Bacillus sp. ISL-7]